MKLFRFKKKDEVKTLRKKLYATLAKCGFAFDAPKVESYNETPLTQVERAELLVAAFRAPIATLQNWTAVAVTDHGKYRMKVSYIDRDQVFGQVNLIFGPIEATRLVFLREGIIFDDVGRLVNVTPYIARTMQAGDTFNLPYAIKL